jgi:hypothetical protein
LGFLVALATVLEGGAGGGRSHLDFGGAEIRVGAAHGNCDEHLVVV